jgi:hypothetical protein
MKCGARNSHCEIPGRFALEIEGRRWFVFYCLHPSQDIILLDGDHLLRLQESSAMRISRMRYETSDLKATRAPHDGAIQRNQTRFKYRAVSYDMMK